MLTVKVIIIYNVSHYQSLYELSTQRDRYDFLVYIQGGPKKTAQSLWHHNFATVHHRVKRFSAKCSERNSLHGLSQCLNTAVKYSLFLQLAIELLKNNVP